MVHLNGGRVAAIENVAQYVIHLTHANHGTNDHFAYVVHDEETGRDTLHMALLNPGRDGRGNWGTRGIYNGNRIESLCWAHDSAVAVFIDNTETTDKSGKPCVNSALLTWHDVPGRFGQGKFTRLNAGDSMFLALRNPVISADGTRVAAEEHSERGNGNVRLWSSEGELQFTIERGQNPRISRDSRWLSALQKPPNEASGTARPANNRAGQTLVLVNLQDGSRRAFDFVLSYDMTYDSTYVLYLQSPEAKAVEGASKGEATEPAAKQRTSGTLYQVPLNSARLSRMMRPYQPGKAFTKEHVVEFVTHPKNDHFAYVFQDEVTGGNTLHIVKWGIRAWYRGDRIEDLNWAGGSDGSDDSIILGFLSIAESTGKDGKRRSNSALYTWQPGQSANEKFTRVDNPQ